eukprot:TRINITY_DN14638_c0_g1_i1.p1 TRINITY_DN14638_c0_g1~~TRINITY_DN14638_c0_g1_i1.p1  ORF type:complete len:1653 (-),score=497.49 TRINITY_DN14638_c0_g1_i1:198-5156(-)
MPPKVAVKAKPGAKKRASLAVPPKLGAPAPTTPRRASTSAIPAVPVSTPSPSGGSRRSSLAASLNASNGISGAGSAVGSRRGSGADLPNASPPGSRVGSRPNSRRSSLDRGRERFPDAASDYRDNEDGQLSASELASLGVCEDAADLFSLESPSTSGLESGMQSESQGGLSPDPASSESPGLQRGSRFPFAAGAAVQAMDLARLNASVEEVLHFVRAAGERDEDRDKKTEELAKRQQKETAGVVERCAAQTAQQLLFLEAQQREAQKIFEEYVEAKSAEALSEQAVALTDISGKISEQSADLAAAVKEAIASRKAAEADAEEGPPMTSQKSTEDRNSLRTFLLESVMSTMRSEVEGLAAKVSEMSSAATAIEGQGASAARSAETTQQKEELGQLVADVASAASELKEAMALNAAKEMVRKTTEDALTALSPSKTPGRQVSEVPSELLLPRAGTCDVGEVEQQLGFISNQLAQALDAQFTEIGELAKESNRLHIRNYESLAAQTVKVHRKSEDGIDALKEDLQELHGKLLSGVEAALAKQSQDLKDERTTQPLAVSSSQGSVDTEPNLVEEMSRVAERQMQEVRELLERQYAELREMQHQEQNEGSARRLKGEQPDIDSWQRHNLLHESVFEQQSRELAALRRQLEDGQETQYSRERELKESLQSLATATREVKVELLADSHEASKAGLRLAAELQEQHGAQLEAVEQRRFVGQLALEHNIATQCQELLSSHTQAMQLALDKQLSLEDRVAQSSRVTEAMQHLVAATGDAVEESAAQAELVASQFKELVLEGRQQQAALLETVEQNHLAQQASLEEHCADACAKLLLERLQSGLLGDLLRGQEEAMQSMLEGALAEQAEGAAAMQKTAEAQGVLLQDCQRAQHQQLQHVEMALDYHTDAFNKVLHEGCRQRATPSARAADAPAIVAVSGRRRAMSPPTPPITPAGEPEELLLEDEREPTEEPQPALATPLRRPPEDTSVHIELAAALEQRMQQEMTAQLQELFKESDERRYVGQLALEHHMSILGNRQVQEHAASLQDAMMVHAQISSASQDARHKPLAEAVQQLVEATCESIDQNSAEAHYHITEQSEVLDRMHREQLEALQEQHVQSEAAVERQLRGDLDAHRDELRVMQTAAVQAVMEELSAFESRGNAQRHEIFEALRKVAEGKTAAEKHANDATVFTEALVTIETKLADKFSSLERKIDADGFRRWALSPISEEVASDDVGPDTGPQSASSRLAEQLRKPSDDARRMPPAEEEQVVQRLRFHVEQLQERLTRAERARDAATNAGLEAMQKQSEEFVRAIASSKAELCEQSEMCAFLRSELWALSRSGSGGTLSSSTGAFSDAALRLGASQHPEMRRYSEQQAVRLGEALEAEAMQRRMDEVRNEASASAPCWPTVHAAEDVLEAGTSRVLVRQIRVACPGAPEDSIEVEPLPNGVRVIIQEPDWWSSSDEPSATSTETDTASHRSSRVWEKDFQYDHQVEGHLELSASEVAYDQGVLSIVLRRARPQRIKLSRGCAVVSTQMASSCTAASRLSTTASPGGGPEFHSLTPSWPSPRGHGHGCLSNHMSSPEGSHGSFAWGPKDWVHLPPQAMVLELSSCLAAAEARSASYSQELLLQDQPVVSDGECGRDGEETSRPRPSSASTPGRPP